MNRLINLFVAFATIIILYTPLHAQKDTWTAGRPDGHAPIGVMGDHYHSKGEWMVSLRHMLMDMNGMRSGSSSTSVGDVLTDFMVSPSEMQMQMSMLGLMYAISDRVTLTGMTNLVSNDMDLVTRMGGQFNTSSSGLGDFRLGAIIRLLNPQKQSIHANIGLSIPTGDIDQRDATPVSENSPLAYPMQLGSGTFDPYLGLTYLGQSNSFSWGAQGTYTYRVGENDRNFSYGNNFNITGWGAYKATNWLSFSGRLQFMSEGSLAGSASDWNPGLMPLFDIQNSGRSQLDAGVGLNLYVASGSFKNLRFGAEYLFPINQQVDGVQMERVSSTILGIQYAF